MERIIDFLRNYPENIKKYGWIVVIIILVYLFGATLINYERIRFMHFKGVVEKVEYAEDRTPTVTIHGEDYNLFFTFWSNYVKIEKGDMLIKTRGNIHLKVIKPGRKDTLDFDSDK